MIVAWYGITEMQLPLMEESLLLCLTYSSGTRVIDPMDLVAAAVGHLVTSVGPANRKAKVHDNGSSREEIQEVDRHSCIGDESLQCSGSVGITSNQTFIEKLAGFRNRHIMLDEKVGGDLT